MKYELIGSNDYMLNPLETVLKNRGVEDIDKFLNVSIEDTHHWSLLKNMDKAVDCLLKHVKKGSKIFIQYDSDIDGINSGAISTQYLQTVFEEIEIQWRLHEGKQHGIIVDTVPNDIGLVIIPDSGSNQFKEHAELKERGIDVIVLDHHECEKESNDAIVVNNQLSPEYPNKNFSGAGITYKFCKAVDDRLGTNHADYYLDLVSIGNIGDMMDLRDLETRYYVLEGLKKINNPLLKEIFIKQEFSTKGVVNITTTSFYISPLINSMVRVASMQEKIQTVKALLGSQEQVFNKKKNESESIQVATARMLGNVRARQNRQRDKGVKLIEERIIEKNLLDNKILIVNVTGLLEKNLSGLVANQLTRKYKRPVLLISDRGDNIYGGSARGYDRFAVKDLKQFLLDTQKFNFCEGHKQAFGLELELGNLVDIIDEVNEKLSDVDINDDVYDVDFAIPYKHMSDSMIKDLHSYKDVWGTTVQEPTIAFTSVEVNKEDIQLMGKTKNTLKFKSKNIEFIQFSKMNEELFEEMFSEDGTYVIDLVGRCSVNEWNGNVTAQVLMDDFEIKKVKKKEFLF